MTVPNEFAECVATCAHFRSPGPNGEVHWCGLMEDRAPHLCEPYIENLLRFVEKVKKQVDCEEGIFEETYARLGSVPDSIVLIKLLRRYLNELVVGWSER